MVKLLDNYPFSDEWKVMELGEDLSNRDKYHVVYKKNDDGNWHLYDLYCEDDTYEGEYIMVPVGSVYRGLAKVNKGTKFVNVLRSTRDPKPIKRCTWIELMRLIYRKYQLDEGLLEECCTDGNFYMSNTGEIVEDKSYRGWIVGGHILLHRERNRYNKVGDKVFMLPICNSHNTSRVGQMKWTGAGFYMVTKCDIWALVLDRFLQNEKVQRYLNYDDCNN